MPQAKPAEEKAGFRRQGKRAAGRGPPNSGPGQGPPPKTEPRPISPGSVADPGLMGRSSNAPHPRTYYLIKGHYSITWNMAKRRSHIFLPPEWTGEDPRWIPDPPLIDTRSGHDLEHTARIKTYPASGTWECLTASRPIFREPGWESHRDSHVLPALPPENAEQQPKTQEQKDHENLLRSVRRAKVKFRDLALSTEFKYFVTLTLNKEHVDRCDPVAVTKKLNAWCSNMVQRHGLAYILVPELHQKGGIHFHGFFNDALPVVDSGTISLPGEKKPHRPRSDEERRIWLEQGGQVVYNLPAWSLGFTTAIEIYGSYPAAVGYCCKYIGKDMTGKIGGRWYYSGGDLTRPQISYADLSIYEQSEQPGAYTFEVPEARVVLCKETGNL